MIWPNTARECRVDWILAVFGVSNFGAIGIDRISVSLDGGSSLERKWWPWRCNPVGGGNRAEMKWFRDALHGCRMHSWNATHSLVIELQLQETKMTLLDDNERGWKSHSNWQPWKRLSSSSDSLWNSFFAIKAPTMILDYLTCRYYGIT